MTSHRPFAPGSIQTIVAVHGAGSPVETPRAADALDHALRRAEEEAIAMVRLGETAAAERHAEMSALYSARALDLLDAGQDEGAGSG